MKGVFAMKTKATSRIFKQTFAWILALMMVFSIFPATQVNAATKPKLSKTKITMTVGQSKKLKVKGISKKRAKRIKWKSSKKKGRYCHKDRKTQSSESR